MYICMYVVMGGWSDVTVLLATKVAVATGRHHVFDLSAAECRCVLRNEGDSACRSTSGHHLGYHFHLHTFRLHYSDLLEGLWTKGDG